MLDDIDLTGLIWKTDHPFAGPWLPISSAPRNGRVITVVDFDNASAEVSWNPVGTNRVFQRGLGIWEGFGGRFTWSEEDGHGPTHWRPCHDEMPAFLIRLAQVGKMVTANDA